MTNPVNVTIRVEEETKRQFDTFCDNVGMNMTTALTMFIKSVLRTRELPFPVTDAINRPTRQMILARGKEALKEAQEQAAANGTSEMPIDEIIDEIDVCRREKKG